MKSERVKKNRLNVGKYGYVFILPFFLIFITFHLYPIVYTFYLSFFRTDLETMETYFSAFKNYEILIRDKVFYASLLTNIILWVMSMVPQMLTAVVLASVLNAKWLKGKGIYKAVYYLPNLVTAASIGTLFYFLFSWQTGSVNKLLMAISLIDEPINWLDSPTYARLITAFIQWWMWFGYSMIIFNASIRGISEEIFQAAAVDGANSVQTFFLITVPVIRPTILYSVITSLIGGMQIFDIPKTLTGGGPQKALNTTVLYIYGTAFTNYNHGYAASMSYGLMVVIMALSLVFYKILYKREEV